MIYGSHYAYPTDLGSIHTNVDIRIGSRTKLVACLDRTKPEILSHNLFLLHEFYRALNLPVPLVDSKPG